MTGREWRDVLLAALLAALMAGCSGPAGAPEPEESGRPWGIEVHEPVRVFGAADQSVDAVSTCGLYSIDIPDDIDLASGAMLFVDPEASSGSWYVVVTTPDGTEADRIWASESGAFRVAEGMWTFRVGTEGVGEGELHLSILGLRNGDEDALRASFACAAS